MAKHELIVFFLTQEMLIHRVFIVKPTKKRYLETPRIFTIGTLLFKKLARSCRTFTADFECFDYCNLERDLLKN